MAEYVDGATTVNITRLHRATPPLQGTFDVEIFGDRAEGSSAIFRCELALYYWGSKSSWNYAHYFPWNVSLDGFPTLFSVLLL